MSSTIKKLYETHLHNGEYDLENLYIEDDNLEVLKCLSNAYSDKTKMIYIDPSHNTGNDFIYKDNYKKSYIEQISQDEKGHALTTNKDTDGRYHTNWLNMMYPRLMLAQRLLTDDGVIFISIDDNEQANLKKMCDEVFGADNFVAIFPRVTKKGGKSSVSTAKNHDYILIYLKSNTDANLCGVTHNDDAYCNKDEYFEERGYYKLNQTLDYDSLGYVKSLDYPIEINGSIFYAGGNEKLYNERQNGNHGRADWGWRWSKDLFEFGYKNGFIEVKTGGARPRIYTKTYQNVKISASKPYEIINIERTKPLSTLEFSDNEYSNDNAKKEFDKIFKRVVFEHPKGTSLIKRCSELIRDKNAIILDFFSGSATTAHAVMQLNAEDGGKRKFIMVQLPEVCDPKKEAAKAGYKNICEIGKERIRRASDKIVEELIKKGKAEEATKLDIGFKVYCLRDMKCKLSDFKES